MRNLAITNIIVDVTKHCNLACDYCFVSNLNQGREYMHPETFLRVLDWFLHDASGEKTDVQLGFFGGERLINKRLLRQMIKTATEKAQRCGKHLKISVNTNGTLLNESILDFFECHNIMLHVSIDGYPETHNRHRQTFNGHGSYNLVAPALNRLVLCLYSIDG